MRTVVLGQVPDSDTTTTIAADDLALVWMNDYIIDWTTMAITALNRTAASFPDFHSSILGASNHPLPFAVERNAGDVVGMAFKGQDRVWVSRFDIVEFDAVVACSGKEPFIRRYTETINLRVRVLNCARAYSRKSLPEPIVGGVRLRDDPLKLCWNAQLT